MTSTHTPFKPRVKARVKKVDPTILSHNDSDLKHGTGSCEVLTTDDDLVYEEIIFSRVGPDRAVPTSLMSGTFDSTKPPVDSDLGRPMQVQHLVLEFLRLSPSSSLCKYFMMVGVRGTRRMWTPRSVDDATHNLTNDDFESQDMWCYESDATQHYLSAHETNRLKIVTWRCRSTNQCSPKG